MSQAFGRRCAATAVLREVHGELRRHARRHREHPAKGRHCGVTMTRSCPSPGGRSRRSPGPGSACWCEAT